MEKWLNKITIKFGMELKLTQNSRKSQLYKIVHYKASLGEF